MNPLRLGSLFDGIGGWLIASVRNGIEPVWASEIEPFPISVTKKHFPNVQHFGDITKIKGTDVPNVDILCAGSPCQGLSVAGKQKGLADERSGLFVEAVRLFFELREAHPERPCRFFIWENVMGCFTTGAFKGADFRAVIESLCKDTVPMPESGKWCGAGVVRSARCDIAWRCLDAQFWGVPQRRRRVFLVADFGKPDERKPEILFIEEGLRGNPQKSKRTRKDSAATADESIDDSGGCYSIAGNTIDRKTGNGGNGTGVQPDVSYTLNTMDRHAVAIRERCGCDGGGKGLLYGIDKAHTVSTRQDQMVFSKTADNSNCMKSDNPHSGFFETDIARTLDCTAPSMHKNQGGEAVVVSYDITHPCDVVRENGQGAIQTLKHRMGTGGNQVPLVQCLNDQGGAVMNVSEIAATLRAQDHGHPPCVFEGGSENILLEASQRTCTEE